MTEISLETVTGKLNRVGHDAFFKALRQAKAARNSHVELAHWMVQVLQLPGTDIDLIADHFKLDRSRLLATTVHVIEHLDRNVTQLAGVGRPLLYGLDRGWHYATLMFGEMQIRTGHVLLGALLTEDLKPNLLAISKQFATINSETLSNEFAGIVRTSVEETMPAVDGSTIRSGEAPGAAAPPGQGTTALDRFSQDLTAQARSGTMDPVRGRDEEIRQVIDVLMRRRQNNPILTGEAGVGKTALVEGFAQRVAADDVPPALKGVTVRALDIGLMQAGASMKGEFEQRLRSVIDEVQGSPTPIILFIDEAHTLIGAGGQAGTGDAANLLKPALARGTLRTIAATTWAEYRQHIEKDPALTRRFQPIQVDEPDADRCCHMLRGLLKPMEEHHKVRIADAAVVAAVHLSQRYIPARQLPDKAVSLLDTACARVAVSQSTTPALLADEKVAIAALETEKAALLADRDLGTDEAERLSEIEAELAEAQAALATIEAEWAKEKAILDEIARLRTSLGQPEADAAAIRAELKAKADELEAIVPERRMMYPHVDEQSVAAVVSDWTGIPAGRMVKDEIEVILDLGAILNQRVVGQRHGLDIIAKRIETSRAKLDNPNKPIGVFMLCGPSGVGKTETALALAEAIYGGEQNIVTINMSEFQEAHSVSTLKGAPPGYVGYGEGGRLTEAVRRKPYSVILLDEVEKAHPDVHEIFFQVFDKGQMEDGTGRRIDFKNTLIILTSNVGTDVIMAAARQPTPVSPEILDAALRPELLKVFPPALLGRLVVIPYFPLSPTMLEGIVRLQLDRIGDRIADNHGTAFRYDQSVVDHIVSLCDNPDSGGRMIDNVITNTLLTDLSRGSLSRALNRDVPSMVRVVVKDGALAYEWADGSQTGEAVSVPPASPTEAEAEGVKAEIDA